MPFALSGGLTILLAQAAAACGSDAIPVTAPQPGTALIVQRDDGFAIVAAGAAAVKPVTLPLGSSVRIDPALIGDDVRRIPGARQ